MLSAATRGVLIGACAGLVLALNDFGAMWLWLDMASDRWALLGHLAGVLLPVGALLGLFAVLLVRALVAGLQRVLPQRSRHAALPHAITLLLTPGIGFVAWQLFSGGSASRLPAVWLLKPVVAIVLAAGIWGSVAGLQRTIGQGASPQRTKWIGAALVVLAHGAIKLNQWVLPNHYDYLHATLAFASWVAVAIGIGAIGAHSRTVQANPRRITLVGALLCLPMVLWLASTVRALPNHQNVAVAMLDARACHARSLMLIGAPLMRVERARRTPQPTQAPRRLQAKTPITDAGSGNAAAQDAHVLLITIDALRADHLGAYGYTRPTSPKLDQLARESLVFERTYAQAPHSSYSLSSLMTSEYVHETLDLGAAPPEATLATALAASGYHTAAFYTLGIFHTAAERLSVYERNAFGFALHDHRDREPEALTDRVLEEIDRVVAQGEPNTLIWAHYFNVHEPYRATTFGTTDIDRYDSEILRADAAVERLIRQARKRFKRDVIAVVTADHGEEFREHGGVYHGSTLYEEQVRVPLIVSAPSLAPGRVHAPVEMVDIAPTLIGMVNVTQPASMRGDDLRALLDNEDDAPPAFSAVIHKRMVVKWPYKLIADLRFGLYELYALDRDPAERKNLATSEPQLLATMREEVYGWLDSLATSDTAQADPRMLAIDQGRLGDRRAVPTLIALIQDEQADVSLRREAGVILGKLADPKSTAGLLAALKAKDPMVAGEAAIALGRLHHVGGREILRRLVLSEDPDIRSRAAVSLGRLRDTAAVPALVDALWVAPNDYEREEAIRWLGRLRDNRALEPLISLLPESRTRHLVVVALGAIGDPRAFDTLRDVLRWEHHANIRDSAVRGLGMLKDPRGLDLVLPLAVNDPALKYATESLVRLDALKLGAIGGADMVAKTPRQGFGRCTEFSERHDWDYLHRSVCETTRTQVSVEIHVPTAIAQSARGATLVVAVRRLDAQEATALRVQVGEHALPDVQVDAGWIEPRWPVEQSALTAGRMRVVLSSSSTEARFVLDHILLLPR